MLRRWPMRRRMLVLTLVLLAALVLSAPLWLGYFGPEAAAHASVWRPWRTQLSLRDEAQYDVRTGQVAITAVYRDPWPGQGRSPGQQFDFMQVRRSSRWLPWVVVAHGSGP
jgi:hypothetical protein